MFFESKAPFFSALTKKGLNVMGACTVQPHEFDSILPNCRSVVVLGNSGRDLFEHFVDAIKEDHAVLNTSHHPLDDFVEHVLEQAIQAESTCDVMKHGTWIMCSQKTDVSINFMSLAERAGLGWKSHLGILIHPTYGLWIGLRAAFFSTQSLKTLGIDESVSALKESPCISCHRPCEKKCHYQAIDENGWNMEACAKGHLLEDKKNIDPHSSCFASCDARLSCPIGRDFRHGDLQHHYHYHRPSGRRRLAEELQVVDHIQGDGPYWHWVFERGEN